MKFFHLVWSPFNVLSTQEVDVVHWSDFLFGFIRAVTEYEVTVTTAGYKKMRETRLIQFVILLNILWPLLQFRLVAV